jgi:putative ABC transport system ATP-binding protein
VLVMSQLFDMMPLGVLKATLAELRQNGTTVLLSSGRPEALDLDAWYWLGAREQRRFTDKAAFLRFVAERGGHDAGQHPDGAFPSLARLRRAW